MTKQDIKAPAPNNAPEPSAFERMRELTRRIIRVPKSELPTKKRAPKKGRHR
ncbi:MAG: hypothetical protein WKG32_12255 [Gemmatimonadaceae bacterium]